MGNLLKLIGKLFPGQLSKTIGTRTNVITLPDKELRRVYTSPMDIEKATDEQVELLKKRIEKIIPDLPKLNDGQKLVLENNLARLDRRLAPKPEAEVFDLGTRTKVSPQGVEQLGEDLGLPADIDPNSGIGQLMARTKRVVKEGRDLADEFGVKDDLKSGLKSLGVLQDEAEIRGVARALINDDIKSGRLKNLSPGMKEGMLNPTGSGLDGDPLEVLARYYDRDAMEVIEMLTQKHGATPDGIDLIKLDLKNKVGIQDSFEFKPLDTPTTPGGVTKGKIPLTQKEVVEFFTGVDKDGNPIPRERLEFYDRNIDLADNAADTQNYLKRFTDDEGGQQEFLRNLPSKLDVDSVLKRKENKLTPEQIEQLKFKSSTIDPDDPTEFAQGGLAKILGV